MYLFGADGKIIAGVNDQGEDLAGGDRSNRDYVRAILDGKERFVSGEVVKAASGDEAIFGLAVAVKGKDGRTVGGLAMTPSWTKFAQKYVYPVKAGTTRLLLCFEPQRQRPGAQG